MKSRDVFTAPSAGAAPNADQHVPVQPAPAQREHPVLAAAAEPGDYASRPFGRRPGRPLEMSSDDVLQLIRQLAQRKVGLFRIHLTHPRLYARARRLFNAWSNAVREAGVDYELQQVVTRVRSMRSRRLQRRTRDSGNL